MKNYAYFLCSMKSSYYICSVLQDTQRPKIRKGHEINEFLKLKNMKAIKVFIDMEEQHKMLPLIEELNKNDDIAMMCVGETEFVIAASGECAMAYAKAVLAKTLNDCTIENCK